MQGLTLAREFYHACRPVLWEEIPDIMARAAIGLVGEGSECFGCDDTASRDHDFGPAFCLWLPHAELQRHAPRIEAALRRLPAHFGGFDSRLAPAKRLGRVGPLAVEDFYTFFTGLSELPATWQEWLAIPEYQLAACTNGEVFEDGAGEFTRRRRALLAGYPDDVRLKKMAARCMIMAQAGQYNLPRCLQRGDGPAAMFCVTRFAEAALSLVYLCNARYMPFYKWAARLASSLPILGAEVTQTVNRLAAMPLRGAEDMEATRVAEDFCAAVARHLRHMGLSQDTGNWLWAHGPQIMRHVREPQLRHMDMLQG
ncbi:MULTISPECIES: DUF4037 domain-containing protein [Desulfovibrio]|uniref:DUF4037 domain-containing protein n=3 Tax=Desulfovibrio TaxID=872 RepID=A0AA94HTU0_DESDE|nr:MULTISPECIES: DUF4037 domain-containing protein [Desulfovibrio]ATD81476.1 DUF4037 domain-containing protein [Desulfovibrio sp. G11]MDY0202809.1 DUF4037 domain-containing protein [Desulfovibrio desulfuricans]SFW59331.1 protein of unknown function [Desulfovibrio desulfuricans]SPD34173.1 Protein of unknown function DUF4037 [Desulfovibrio sp. G11]